MALAYPIRQYVSQRGEVADLQRQREQARERVEQLRDLKARWQDDAYAEQRIRERLHYVMPGETGYIVIDPDAAKKTRADQDGGGPGLVRQPLGGRRQGGRLRPLTDRRPDR